MTTSKGKSLKCPFKFVELEENEEIKRDFLGYEDGLVQSVPEKWVLCPSYGPEYADQIYNFKLRPDDVWIATYPKCGTTWMQHITSLLLSDLDFDNQVFIDDRSPFIEFDHLIPKKKYIKEFNEKLSSGTIKDESLIKDIKDKMAVYDSTVLKMADNLTHDQPRLIKTHLAFSLLPPNLIDQNKVIYVARDPREVLVAYYHHHKLIRHHEFVGDFKQFFNYFLNGKLLHDPFWPHIKQAWKLKNHPNMCFIFFVDMKKDIRGVVDKVMNFLDIKYPEERIQELIENLHIDKMRENPAIDNTQLGKRLGIFKNDGGSFIGNKNKLKGGWRDYFDDSMTKEITEWMERNTQGTDLPMDKLWLS